MVYSYIVGRFVYKELDAKAAYKALRDTVIVNGATTFMVGLSSAFAAYLSLAGIPRTLAAAMLGITDNKILLFVLINLFLLIVGCLVDNIPAFTERRKGGMNQRISSAFPAKSVGKHIL